MPRRLVLGVVLLALGCARNPVTGKRELALVSREQEIQIGQQASEEIAASIGLYPDPQLAAYVERLGKGLAARSERPELPWSFQVADDAAVNAFALPGGPIFVTRGILAHSNSEAELAAVLGHEIGHVAARHGVQQISRVQLAQLGLGVGALLRPDLAKYAEVASLGLGLLFLQHSRDAERQADQLGFRYGLEAGYDMRAMSDMFETLTRVGEQSDRGRLPVWLSTHPNPEDRLERNQERLQQAGVDWSRYTTGREEHFALLNGIVYGNDPRQGFFEGGAFLHPDQKFRIDFPAGWRTENTAQAVTAVSPGKEAVIQLAVAGKLSPEQAAERFFAQEGVRPLAVPGAAPPPSSRYFEAQTGQGAVNGLASFFAHGGRTYMLVGFTSAGRLGGYDPAFRATLASFGPLTDPAALSVQPARIELVKAPREMTLAEVYALIPSSVPLEEIALINGMQVDTRVPAGTTLKRVVGSRSKPGL